MQIFSDLSMISQTGQASAGQLPFSFGMTAEQGQEFYDILQQTVQDLESGTLNNEEIAAKLAFIDQTIPDELMTKIEQALEENTDIDLDSEDKTDELSAKAFAVLNLIDNIIDDINKVENSSDLTNSMSLSGVSQSNIETTLQMLDEVSQTTDQSIQAAYEQKAEKAIIKENLIAQFKANQQTNPQNLAEKVLTGKQLAENTNTQTATLLPNNTTTDANTDQDVLNQQPTTPVQTESSKKQDKTINEMLALFKKTKSEAEQAGLNLDLKNIKAAQDSSAITPAIKTAEAPVTTTEQVNIIANNSTQTQAQATTQAETIFKQDNSKTNGEINKSEFKELSSKFVADIADSSTTETADIKVEEFKPINQTAATENNISFNKAFVNTQATNQQIHLEGIDIAQTEQVEQTAEAKQDAKLASNFNQHLYKVAQEASSHMQVTAALKTFKDQNMQQLKVKLNPEELGAVTIDMEMIDGTARGVITVERPEVAQQLAQNLKDIFQNFKQAGINVEDIVVKVDDEKPQNGNQQQEHQQAGEGRTQELEFTFGESDLVDIQV